MGILEQILAELRAITEALYILIGADVPSVPPPADENEQPLGVMVAVEMTHGFRYYTKKNKAGFPIMDRKDTGFRAISGEVFLVQPQQVKADGGSYWWEVIGKQSPDPTSFAIYLPKVYYLDASKVAQL